MAKTGNGQGPGRGATPEELPLSDQRLVFEPQPEQFDGAGEIDVETDLDIIANTFRAVIDQHAFEAMIASWSSKLDKSGDDAAAARGLSGPLMRQLALARQAMDHLDIPADNDPLNRAVQEVGGAAVVLAPDGRIAATNELGEAAFGGRQGVFLDRGVIDPRSAQDFDALCRAANARGNRSQAILRILPAGGRTPAFLAEAYLLEAPGQDKSFVVIRSIEIDWSAEASARLATAFGLSEAETEVARLFYETRSIERVAAARGVTVLTVRGQIKTVMAKTEAGSQADLIRLLAMVASRALIGRHGVTAAWRDPLGREQQVRLEDGRIVAWTWMGAEDGRPAVLSRGFPMGYLLPAEAEARLRAAGVKLYALSRPGYGNSTLDPALDVLADNLAALRAFLAARDEGPVVGVGTSNGIVPLLADAAARPERYRALIAIGYTGVFDRSGVQRLPLIQRTMMRMVAVAPWLVEMMAKSGHRMMQQHGVDWYLERAYRTRPRDMATYGDPNMAPLLRNACAHLLTQGHTAFTRDLMLARAPVDADLDRLAVPLLWLAPTEDGVFDAARYARIARRNPRVTMEPLEAAAELALYQRTDRIIEAIIAATRGE